jgi:ATP-binding cassette subfamily B protein
MSGVTQKLAFRMRREISEKIGRMPMKYFESRSIGDVLSRITNDVDTLSQGMNQSIAQLITSVTTICGVVCMMLTISPIMTLIALAILPVSAGLVALVVKFSQKYFKSPAKAARRNKRPGGGDIFGYVIVKAYNREQAALRSLKRPTKGFIDPHGEPFLQASLCRL